MATFICTICFVYLYLTFFIYFIFSLISLSSMLYFAFLSFCKACWGLPSHKKSNEPPPVLNRTAYIFISSHCRALFSGCFGENSWCRLSALCGERQQAETFSQAFTYSYTQSWTVKSLAPALSFSLLFVSVLHTTTYTDTHCLLTLSVYRVNSHPSSPLSSYWRSCWSLWIMQAVVQTYTSFWQVKHHHMSFI